MSKNKNIYFTHIPKTAGTSIESLFYYSQENKITKYYIGQGYFIKYIKHKYTDYYKHFLEQKYYDKLLKFNDNIGWKIVFFHIPLSFYKTNILLDYKKKFNIFCSIRNPYDRIISDFKYWIRIYNEKNSNQISKKKFKKLLNQIRLIYQNDFSLTEDNLNKFIKNILSSKKYYYLLDGHFIHQYKYIYKVTENNNLIKIPDFIIRFENLKNDLNILIKKYDLKININKLNKVNPTNNVITKKNLNKNSISLIYNFYKLDFILLKYKYNSF